MGTAGLEVELLGMPLPILEDHSLSKGLKVKRDRAHD